MRRGLLVFLLVNLLIISFLVRSVSTLLSLLVEDASADAIHRAELPSPNSSLIEQRPQIIPKIIHQTYKNETIPEMWMEAQQSCVDLHPDYEYIVCDPGPKRESVWGGGANTFGVSSGRTTSRASLLLPSTPGSLRYSMATHTRFSGQIRSDILSWRTTAERILIWMTYESHDVCNFNLTVLIMVIGL